MTVSSQSEGSISSKFRHGSDKGLRPVCRCMHPPNSFTTGHVVAMAMAGCPKHGMVLHLDCGRNSQVEFFHFSLFGSTACAENMGTSFFQCMSEQQMIEKRKRNGCLWTAASINNEKHNQHVIIHAVLIFFVACPTSIRSAFRFWLLKMMNAFIQNFVSLEMF